MKDLLCQQYKLKNITSYSILSDLCKVREITNTYGRDSYLTNRVKFIGEYLDRIGVEYSHNVFDESDILCNIEVVLGNTNTDKTIILLAHHDIVNINSDNMNDNSASVSHLLCLISRIKDLNLNKRVIIVFTDAEEIGGLGSQFLSMQIKNGHYGDVEWCLNLELTGFGEELHIENYDSNLSNLLLTENKDIFKLSVPFNDSIQLRRYGIDSICIGLLPIRAINERNTGSYPNEWMLCHSIEDKFENANESDMNMFNDFLFNFVTK